MHLTSKLCICPLYNIININFALTESAGAKSSVLRSVIVTAGPTKRIILCTHHKNVQGIVVIYHQCADTNKNLELSTVHFNTRVGQNETMASVSVEAGCYHVAVFGVSAEYRVEESPAKVVQITVYNGKQLYTLPLCMSYLLYVQSDTMLHTAGAPERRTDLIQIFGECIMILSPLKVSLKLNTYPTASLFAVSLLVVILLIFGIICKQILRIFKKYKASKGDLDWACYT